MADSGQQDGDDNKKQGGSRRRWWWTPKSTSSVQASESDQCRLEAQRQNLILTTEVEVLDDIRTELRLLRKYIESNVRSIM